MKEYFLLVMFDPKGRFCSARTNLLFHKRTNNDAYIFLSESPFSVQETIYRVLNNVSLEKKFLCKCGHEVQFHSFKKGFYITCGSEVCLRKSYGKNPHIPTHAEKIDLSSRMKVKNPMQDGVIALKVHTTQIKKYGCFPIHTNDAKEKALNSRYDKYNSFAPKSNLFKVKDFIMPSGKIVRVQGYEDRALTILLRKYSEEDIEVCGRNHKFIYSLQGKEHKFYPDIYIKSENRYIDVKSKYTYKSNLEKNLEKEKAVINQGFHFDFMILKPL